MTRKPNLYSSLKRAAANPLTGLLLGTSAILVTPGCGDGYGFFPNGLQPNPGGVVVGPGGIAGYVEPCPPSCGGSSEATMRSTS